MKIRQVAAEWAYRQTLRRYQSLFAILRTRLELEHTFYIQ